jgi:hypothetical protein
VIDGQPLTDNTSDYGGSIMENFALEKEQPNMSRRISRLYGDSLIGTLRDQFGQEFALNIPAHAKLDDVLHKLDVPSLRKLADAATAHKDA